MSQLSLITRSPEQTQQLGEAVGRLALPGDVFLLVGQLGTGKTCLTQGIARGLDVTAYASSPTFVIMRELPGRLTLYHIDLYRLDDIREIADLGLDDYLYGRGVCVVEWAEKGLDVLPVEYLLIEIEHRGPTERAFRLKAGGQRYRDLLSKLRETGAVPRGE